MYGPDLWKLVPWVITDYGLLHPFAVDVASVIRHLAAYDQGAANVLVFCLCRRLCG